MFLGSNLVGLIAGLTTGVIGAGSGYVLTPASMSSGVSGIMAVGTDQSHHFAKAIKRQQHSLARLLWSNANALTLSCHDVIITSV
jgi:uncharacterized membrane protein YfcA